MALRSFNESWFLDRPNARGNAVDADGPEADTVDTDAIVADTAIASDTAIVADTTIVTDTVVL